MARRMMLMRQSSVLCFLTLTTLASSISNYCTNYFVFPNLKDSQRINSNSNEIMSVEFRVNSTCSTPFIGAFHVRDNTKAFCTFYHQNDSCDNFANTDYCHCPEEGSDLYRVDIPTAERHNSTWTWSSSASRVKEHTIHIVILVPTSPKSPETTEQTLMTSDSISVSWTTVGSGDERFYTALFSSVPGIIMMTVNVVIVVSFISLVVFVIRRKGRHRTRLAPQHDLALQEIQDCDQQPPHSTPVQQQQQQQQRRLPEIPGQYQVPCSVPARSGLDARRSVGRMSHVYEVVGGDQEGEAPKVLMTELPGTNLHPRPQAQEVTAPCMQASKPGFGNGLYFHIHPTK